MADFEDRRDETPAPRKKKLGIRHVIAMALVGIFVVLTLSNFRAILSPLQLLGSVLSPIVTGLVLAYILNFFLRFFEYKLFKKIKRRTVTRALAMLFSYLLLLLIIVGIFYLVIPSVVESVSDLLANRTAYVTDLFDSIGGFIDGLGIDGLNSQTIRLYEFRDNLLVTLGNTGDWINQLSTFLAQFEGTENWISQLVSMMGSAITVLKNLVVGIFISIYVLLSKERLNAGCRRVFRALLSENAERRLLHYCSTAHHKFGGYMVGKLTDSMLVMFVCMLLFAIFDIPYAVLIAVVIGVTDIIPFFGPFLGAIPSAFIILIADPPKAIVFVLLILVVQQIDGNIIAPAILGDKTGLSSLGVIVAVTVMGDVLGIVGMVIGVPLFALIITLLDDFIKSRLKKKGADTDLNTYFPADAFLRPSDLVREHETMTQKFVHWIQRVETERAGVDYTPSPLHTVGRAFRLGVLNVIRFFRRLFSVHPIPQDRESGIYNDIVKNGMRTDRRFWHTFFLTIATLGVYPFYLQEIVAQTVNIACRRDRKRTWGAFPFIMLSLLTIGVYPIIWHCMVIARFRDYCRANGEECRITRKYYLCWTLIGLPTLVGPMIAIARFLDGFSQVCAIYNATHTFPLSEEDLREDEEVEILPEPRREHIPLIDQIALPNESVIEKNAELDAMEAAEAKVCEEQDEAVSVTE